MKRYQNHGAFLLAKHGQGQIEVASRLGCSQSLVARWVSGGRFPTPEMREKIREAYGIPAAAWDEPVPGSPPPGPAPAAPPRSRAKNTPFGPASVHDRALALASDIDRLRADAMSATDVTPLERMKLVGAAARALETLGKITGQSGEISEAKLLASPAWARIQEALVGALRPWPDALRAVGEELRRRSAP